LKAGNLEEIPKRMMNTFNTNMDFKQNSTFMLNSVKNSPSKQANDDDDDEIQFKYNPAREYEIQKEVERYRQKLQDELLKVINEEKQKEEERETFFKNISDEEEKKKAEILINLQRSESSRTNILHYSYFDNPLNIPKGSENKGKNVEKIRFVDDVVFKSIFIGDFLFFCKFIWCHIHFGNSGHHEKKEQNSY